MKGNKMSVAKELGFESEKEMVHLVCEVDLTNPIKMQRFQLWGNNDGTKVGLLKVIEENKK
jgi:hypothetical protein